jgi:hypothetical protein
LDGYEAAAEEFEAAWRDLEERPAGRGFYARVRRADRAQRVLIETYGRGLDLLLVIRARVAREVAAAEQGALG